MTAPSTAIGSVGSAGAGTVSSAPRGKGAARASVSSGETILRRVAGQAETWLALGVVVIVALLIVPLPPVILDALLAMSLATAILVLLVTLSVRDPLEFSIFPSLL